MVASILNYAALVSFKELCRIESKTGARSGDSQQGHPRLVAPPHRSASAAVPAPKTSGTAEPACKTNPK